MSVSKKTLKPHSRCIFIDDFMKGGGTAKGIVDLLGEFESELIGIGILIDNIGSEKKLVTDYTAIVDFLGVNDDGEISMIPSEKFR